MAHKKMRMKKIFMHAIFINHTRIGVYKIWPRIHRVFRGYGYKFYSILKKKLRVKKKVAHKKKLRIKKKLRVKKSCA